MIKHFAIVLVSVGLLAGCSDGLFPVGAQEAQKEDPLARPAKIATAQKVAFSIHKTFPSVTHASRSSVLAFRVPGQISDLPVRSGEALKEGDVIARLDDATYQNALAEKQASFDLAKTQLERTRTLFKQNHVAKASLDTAQSTFDSAAAALKSARENVDYATLHAPYDGTVATVDVERYQYVGAGTTVVNFQDGDNIDVIFNVPEKIFLIFNPMKLVVKPQVNVRFDALPNRVFTAVYKEHEAQPDAVTRSFRVTVTMPRPEDITVLPGMSVSVDIDMVKAMSSQGIKGLVVPLGSVFDEGGKKWVWRVDENNQTRKTAVDVFGIEEGAIRLKSGLDEGDRVVAVGVAHVTESMKVRPYKKEGGL
ncbi:RND family efflux transporter, MFP subunit [Cohaesibacter sp. ES.047]|uniref:efflux RND transporter periplasmic adaptor subunit n=1 Tax=Cohaesibacter sp. ES.047 TaxID=1798205 RepID=UPI000BB8A138|nr:efflux RND transporter periplasmic adaptor subunit [Cohaesibacter sp. ES.047]SNY93121.1 RND family efflux transporter, MFP subunit [Cohaesibacter sp. ES.047]